MLGIEGETIALDFNLACSYRLLVFDNERERDRFNALSAILGGSAFGGDKSESDEGETVTI